MTTQAMPETEPPCALLAALSGDGPLGQVGEGLRALVAVWFGGADAAASAEFRSDAAAEPPAGNVGGTDTTTADTMTDDQLVAAVRSIARLERSIESLKLQCTSAIARRSTGDSRHEGLAGRHGYPTPERFIAATTGASTADAHKLVAVAAATTMPESFGTTPRGPRYAHVAAAIAAGSLSVQVAHLITGFLDSVRFTTDPEGLERTEQVLLDRAEAVSVDGLHRYFKLLRAQLDRNGVQAREEELHAQRSLRIWEDHRGLIHLRGCFDPASAAPIKLAVETLVSADLHAARDAKSRFAARAAEAALRSDVAVRPAAAGAVDRALVDHRTIEQMAADALADIARLAAAASDAPPALASASVVVRIDHDDLMNAIGFATIDDFGQPISAATARAIAAASGVIPMVCASDGEVLDLGRRRRLFTKAQRIALAERDGGCAHPDCARPVAHTQAHHIRWWDAHDGPSDLANGVLLCAFHHWAIHHDGWQILNRDGRLWFVPPAHLDPEQRPRPGRRATRLELRAA
ncbi:HNH endonuclease [Agromyces bauzanensis]|uniref:HNH endonuclease n=1 Tax=Agromyces bauzanensis TaxID=1308924 RepID=A0A917UUG4_9MICO|nr:DUF222 domain-containing protein [Agromyces bauzanensis]GGJ85953.1 HNH endonuclease [Agromyces bauzanensis]